MNSRIVYQDNISTISIEALYSIGGYVTYEISISTGGFSGKCNFCIEENILKEYIQRIDYMMNTLSGELEISDCESDANLKVFFEDTMNFYVLGQIGGSHEENTLKFKLKADQTMLNGLKENFLDY